MEKKYYVYYATEENAFETEKNGAFTKDEALKVAKSYLDEYMEDDEISGAFAELNEYCEEGIVNLFIDKYKGYTMAVGIAPKGKLRNVQKTITDMRKEIIRMF